MPNHYQFIRNLCAAFGILSTISATAQPRISVDSVALFQVNEDEYTRGRELLQAKGFVSQYKVHEDGHLDLNVFRQRIGYLTTEKGSGLKAGINTAPALLQIGYQEGRLQPMAEYFPNLGSGLTKPLTYRFQTITSQTGGVRSETTSFTDNTKATDYAQLLRDQVSALGYRGDVYPITRFLVQGGALVVEQTRYQYVPFANRYVPFGQVVRRNYPLEGKGNIYHMLYPNQGTMTYLKADANQLITLDTLGKPVQTLALDGLSGKRLLFLTEVVGENGAAVVPAGEMQQRLGTDWLFGPAEAKAKNPELVLVRTDPQGKLIFRQTLTVSHEDYGLASAAVLSNATESLVNVTLGKGLLKYVIAYAKINAQGVVWQKVWNKEDPAQQVKVNGGGRAFKAFTDMQRLISLPNGENLIVSYDADHSPMQGTTTLIGYGGLHLSTRGDMLRYYSIRASVPPVAGAPLPFLNVLSQPDGRVMVWVNEVRNTLANQFAQFSLIDYEIQPGALPSGNSLVAGQPSALVNATTYRSGELRMGVRSAPETGGGLLGGLSRLAERTSSSIGERTDGGKMQEQIETSPINAAPVLYWIDTKAGQVMVRDFGRMGGYSLPNQPSVIVNRNRNEAYVALRTPLQQTEWPRTNRYPGAVYLKLARMTW